MERDLRLIRQRRAERDRPNVPLPILSSPNGAGDMPEGTGSTQVDGVSTSLNSELSAAYKADTAHMIGQPAEFRPQAPTAQMLELPPKTDDGDIAKTAKGVSKDSERSAGLDIPLPSGSSAKVQDPPDSTDNKTTDTIATAPEGSLDTTDPAVFDFESMFNDNDLVNTDDTTNFGIDFSADNVGQNIMNGSAFENIDMSDVDMANVAPTSNEDINSLLPGLENYVNADTDLSNLGMPADSMLPQPSQPARKSPPAPNGAPAPDVGEIAPVDPSIDHLFDGINFDLPSNGGDEMGDGNLLDLDDFNWD